MGFTGSAANSLKARQPALKNFSQDANGKVTPSKLMKNSSEAGILCDAMEFEVSEAESSSRRLLLDIWGLGRTVVTGFKPNDLIIVLSSACPEYIMDFASGTIRLGSTSSVLLDIEGQLFIAWAVTFVNKNKYDNSIN